MVTISRQYLSGADKAVQKRQYVFVNKGIQPEHQHNKSKIDLLIRISDFFIPASFCFKVSELFNITQYYEHTKNDKAVLKLLNGHQSLCVKTGSDPKCDTFDSKYRDK